MCVSLYLCMVMCMIYVHDLVQVKRLRNKLMYYIFCIVTGKTATLHYTKVKVQEVEVKISQ